MLPRQDLLLVGVVAEAVDVDVDVALHAAVDLGADPSPNCRSMGLGGLFLTLSGLGS